jgi:hypothetical protein
LPQHSRHLQFSQLPFRDSVRLLKLSFTPANPVIVTLLRLQNLQLSFVFEKLVCTFIKLISCFPNPIAGGRLKIASLDGKLTEA